jgi:hypothetical protein
MEYTKPKVTIDLEEYNALLKAKNEKYDPDEVATLAATLALAIRGESINGYSFDSKRLIDEVCREVDYTIDIKLAADHSMSKYQYAIAKVTKKPIVGYGK